jgi:hypothetical protein
MSTAKGGNMKGGKGRAPKHQNSYAFRHNAASKTTKEIYAMPIEGMCQHCNDKIEWRKKYRKYVPLKQPAVCECCSKKAITSAYHKWCKACLKADGTHKCGSCLKTKGIIYTEEQLEAKQQLKLKDILANPELRERERRTAVRKWTKENELRKKKEEDERNSRWEAFDREEAGEGDEEEEEESDYGSEEENSGEEDSEQQQAAAAPAAAAAAVAAAPVAFTFSAGEVEERAADEAAKGKAEAAAAAKKKAELRFGGNGRRADGSIFKL